MPPISGAPGQRFALAGLEAVAEIPDEMPDAAEQMMHQRPGVAEHDQPADEAAGKGLHIGVGGRARRRRRSATRPAARCRNTARCRWRDGRWTAPSSGSSDRSADAAKAVVRSWRSSAAFDGWRARAGPFGDRGRAILFTNSKQPAQRRNHRLRMDVHSFR